MLNNRVDTVELIRIVDAVANEKSIDKELVLTSMEEAIEKAARTRYGQENNIYVSINRANGQIELGRRLKVVENPANSQNEISLKDAQKIKSDIALDQEILERRNWKSSFTALHLKKLSSFVHAWVCVCCAESM